MSFLNKIRSTFSKAVETTKDSITETITMEKARGAYHLPKSKQIYNFSSEDKLKSWKQYTDQEFGGKSTVNFSFENGKAIFSGNISLELPSQRNKSGQPVQKTGFAAVRSQESDEWKIEDHFDALLLKVKGDGRIYVLNVKTESFVRDDLYQAPFSPPANEWCDVTIPLSSFYLTWRGFVEADQQRMSPSRIRSFGFMMAERKEGPFRLEIDSISAVSLEKSRKRYTLD